MKINLQKFIAACGYCSRRKAGDLIKEKKVKVNGGLAEVGMRVDENDHVEIFTANKPTILNCSLKQNKNFVYIKLNKPKGYICTNKKFKNEKNIFDLLPKNFNITTGSFGDIAEAASCSTQKYFAKIDLLTPFPQKTNKLFIAGRLDKESHGLVLLTNDGELVQKLTHPSFEHEKEYLVSVGNSTNKLGCGVANVDVKIILEKFKSGINIPDGFVKAKEIKYLKNNKFSIILTTGKKRQIREMFQKLKCEVRDLRRVRIGNLKLGTLKEGGFEIMQSFDKKFNLI